MLERIVVLFMSDPQTALARQAPSLDLAGPLVPVSFNCHACFFFSLTLFRYLFVMSRAPILGF